MTPAQADTVVADVLDRLQAALRAKDTARVVGLLTDDAALLGTAEAHLDRHDVHAYLDAVFAQPGYVRWQWETVRVVDIRPGAVTFAALGAVGLDDGRVPVPTEPMRLTCLLVEDSGGWRLRLFHGSIPAG